MSLWRSASIEFITRFGRGLVGLLTIAVFVEALGAATYGTFILFEGLLAITGITASLGIGGAVQKRVSGGKEDAVISTAIVLQGAALVVIAIVIAVATPYINNYLGVHLARYLLIALASRQALRLSLHILRGRLRVAEAATIQFGVEFAFIPIGILLSSTSEPVSGLVGAFVVSRVIGAFVSLLLSRPELKAPTLEQARSLLSFSKHNYVASVIGGSVYSWLDTLVLGAFVTPGFVTAYESAWRLSMAVSMLSKAIGTALFPQISRWIAEGKESYVSSAVTSGLTGGLIPVFPAFVGTILLSKPLLTVPFGEETGVASVALIILIAGKVPEAVNDVVVRTLFGLDRPQRPAVAAGSFLVANLSLNLILVPDYGLLGAAIATVTAFLINTIINVAGLSQSISFSIEWSKLAWSIIASGGMGLVLSALLPIMGTSTGVELAIGIGAGISVYTLIFLAHPSIRRQVGIIVSLS